jgi:hypothetical protein
MIRVVHSGSGSGPLIFYLSRIGTLIAITDLKPFIHCYYVSKKMIKIFCL